MEKLKTMQVYEPAYNYIDDGKEHGIFSPFEPGTRILPKGFQLDPQFCSLPVDIVFEKPEVKTYPKLAINLNDKFRFINELFASNANEYHIAIEQLNNVNSLDEANAYIKGLKAIYDWKDDHEMVKNMLALIQKRFL